MTDQEQRYIRSLPAAVLAPSVIDGVAEIARLETKLAAAGVALSEVREILMQSNMQCFHPPDDGGDMCDGEDCIYCACILAIDVAKPQERAE